MDPRRALSKLTPGTMSLTMGSGPGEYSQADVAAALGGLDPLSANLVMVKWSGHDSGYLKLLLMSRIADRAIREKWKLRKGDLTAMTNVAVAEYLYRRDDAQPGLSERKRALASGVPRSRWRRHITHLYLKHQTEITWLLNDSENRALSHIKRLLAG